MTRAGRKVVAWIGLGALLFMQLAVAAYACPMRTDSGGATSTVVVPMTQPCHGMDQELPNLCEQHGIQGSQSATTHAPATVDAPVLPLIAVVAEPQFHVATWHDNRSVLHAIVANPPPLIRFGVLRI